jgi:hypothetical protein
VKSTTRLFELPRIAEARGNLSYLEEEAQVPFEISRVYWIHDVPGGEARGGGHAFREAEEVIVALSGSFEVLVHDGSDTTIFTLNRAFVGLHVPPMHWRELRNFSTNSLALLVASTGFDEADYVRDFDAFRSLHGS